MDKKLKRPKHALKQFPSQTSQTSDRSKLCWKVATVAGLSLTIWLINAWWLSTDTRPPVWDMASHQIYALNYLGDRYADPIEISGPEASGMYPPFVHWLIALIFLALGPHPVIAPIINLPATFILLFCTYDLTSRAFGESAARWSCLLTAAVPYLVWMSRETILDYWLMALVAAGLAALLRTRGFRDRKAGIAFGVIVALGLLTKWLYPLYLLFPFLYVAVQERIWKTREQRINAAACVFSAAVLSGFWYVPRLAALSHHFVENAQIGAMEGEPEVFSFQSFIYYLRLLEGYQLFALLFILFVISWIAVWKSRQAHGLRFFALTIAAGAIGLTLIRTKDPRFSMPLLPLLSIAPGAWIASWPAALRARIIKICLVLALCFQLYLTNVGVAWLPQELVLMKGYQGSLRWDWNLYLQNYFHILGPPRVEDWRQKQILEALRADAASTGRHLTLGFIPDTPRFSVTNFHLYARLSAIPLVIYRLTLIGRGIYPLANVDYVLAKDGDQGMPWTTQTSQELTGLITNSDVFLLINRFPLPDGSVASLYAVDHSRINSR